jgi:sialic acid synthase SpsE
MAILELSNGKIVGANNRPYIVAELNTSHFGDLGIAKEMISATKKAGADCVKFQSWSDSSLYSKTYYDQFPMTKRFIKKFSLKNEELIELSNYAKLIDIDFASTPYSNHEVDFLIEICKVPYIKVASMDLNNLEFLDYMASKKVPMIISTGMSTIDEIILTVSRLHSINANFALLHCVSLYPTPPKQVNLNNISLLRKSFPDNVIGFSDHTLGIENAIASIALGASIIEKHLTLDKSRIGLDNQMAIEQDEFSNMVTSCHTVFDSLGSTARELCDEEIKQRLLMRRSVVSKYDLDPGHVIKSDDLEFKRPGSGIPLSELSNVIGKKVRIKINANEVISRNDLEI